MALLYFDGHETLGVSGGNPLDSTFSRRYYSSDPNDITVQTGKYGRLCFRLADTGSAFLLPAGPRYGTWDSDTTKIWGFSQRTAGSVSSAYYAFRLYTDTSVPSVGIKSISDGSVGLYSHTGALLALSGPGYWRNTSWNRVEIKCYAHASAGTFELWVNGEKVLDETGLNTLNEGSYHSHAYMFSATLFTNARAHWDDCYVCNTSGTTFNDFIGDWTTMASFPSGDDTSNWTPSTGTTHYNLVDEPEPNNDTDYVEDGTVNNVDLFTTTNVSPATVLAVVVGSDVRLDANGTESFRQIIDSGGTQYAGDTVNLTTNAWSYHSDIWEEDPDTSSAWTVNGYNATKLGVEVV